MNHRPLSTAALSPCILTAGCIRFIDLDEQSEDAGAEGQDGDRAPQADSGGDGDSDGDSDLPPEDVCGTCGDGVVRCDEQCEPLSDGYNGCTPDCEFSPLGINCGLYGRQYPERCDDGNQFNGDGCNPTCNFENTVEPFVGTPGVQGSEDGQGQSATLGGWGALALVEDHLFYGDAENGVLRKIDLFDGSVNTIAGQSGDKRIVDAPDDGLSARFATLEALTTDGVTIWVADSGTIRAVDASEPHGVTTVIGGGSSYHCDDGLGTEIDLWDPRGVTYDGGYLYFVDANCATVRRYDPATGYVTTVAGTAETRGFRDGAGDQALLSSPRYMTSTHDGWLYIVDTDGPNIRRMRTSDFSVEAFAGSDASGQNDGLGVAATFDRPRGLTTDGTSLYVCEQQMGTIRQIELANASVTTMIGGCAAPRSCHDYDSPPAVGDSATLVTPFSIAYHFNAGHLYFLDVGAYVIARIR